MASVFIRYVNKYVNVPIGPATAQWKVAPTKWRSKKGAPGGKVPYQGKFYPGNPDKYEGDVSNVIFRSGIELRLMKHLDESSSVIGWSSEEIIIPYMLYDSKTRKDKLHRYFMDFKATIQKKDGSQKTCLIEVKPKVQCAAPIKPKNPKRAKVAQARYERDIVTYVKNRTKWDAAEALCEKKGWQFVIMTEETLRY